MLKAEAGLVDTFCYQELVKLGAVARAHAGRPRKAAELQRFFGVATLDSRCSRCGVTRRRSVAARLRAQGHSLPRCRRMAQAGGDPGAGESSVLLSTSLCSRTPFTKIRAMTLLTPNEFLGPLTELLASTGVALVVCPHFPGTKAHGATFWLGREKAVLLLTISGKWADIFWFSLFHELGHTPAARPSERVSRRWLCRSRGGGTGDCGRPFRRRRTHSTQGL